MKQKLRLFMLCRIICLNKEIEQERSWSFILQPCLPPDSCVSLKQRGCHHLLVSSSQLTNLKNVFCFSRLYVLVTFLLTEIKHQNQGKLQEKGFLWTYDSKSSMMAEQRPGDMSRKLGAYILTHSRY